VIVLFVLGCATLGYSQDEADAGPWRTKTIFRTSFYHLGSYSKEKPSFFLEQNVNFVLSSRFYLGLQMGVNLYPSLLAFPVSLQGKYYLSPSALKMYINQSVGRNIKLGKSSFPSNRYVGSLGLDLGLGNSSRLSPHLGYSFIWDKFGGGALSFFVGLGWEIQL